MEDLNAVNDAQGGNVDAQTEPTAELTTDAGAKDAEPAEQQPQGMKGNQDAAVAAAAAAARRVAEERHKAELQREVDRREAFAKTRGFDSWDAMEKKGWTDSLQSGEATSDVMAQMVAPLIQQAIDNHPAIKHTQELEARFQIDSAIAEFKKEYPNEGVNEVADFLKMPNYQKFYGYVERGMSFAEAYTLANKAVIAQKKVDAAKQETLNKVNSKGHLKKTDGGGDADDVVVPPDVRKQYKQMLPDWTDQQIRDDYAKHHQKE